MDSHSRKIVQENCEYTLFSWSVQGASSPIHMKCGQVIWFWDQNDIGNIHFDYRNEWVSPISHGFQNIKKD